VYRQDETNANGVKYAIPPGSEFDEMKEKFFKLVYPGNGNPSWFLLLLIFFFSIIIELNLNSNFYYFLNLKGL